MGYRFYYRLSGGGGGEVKKFQPFNNNGGASTRRNVREFVARTKSIFSVRIQLNAPKYCQCFVICVGQKLRNEKPLDIFTVSTVWARRDRDNDRSVFNGQCGRQNTILRNSASSPSLFYNVRVIGVIRPRTIPAVLTLITLFSTDCPRNQNGLIS